MAATGLTRLDTTPEFSFVGQTTTQTSRQDLVGLNVPEEQVQVRDSNFSPLLTHVHQWAVDTSCQLCAAAHT